MNNYFLRYFVDLIPFPPNYYLITSLYVVNIKILISKSREIFVKRKSRSLKTCLSQYNRHLRQEEYVPSSVVEIIRYAT